MENPQPIEPAGPENIARRVATGVIQSIKSAIEQLRGSDQNPHEGRLRGSVMPDKYIEVPDHPPVHDDSI